MLCRLNEVPVPRTSQGGRPAFPPVLGDRPPAYSASLLHVAFARLVAALESPTRPAQFDFEGAKRLLELSKEEPALFDAVMRDEIGAPLFETLRAAHADGQPLEPPQDEGDGGISGGDAAARKAAAEAAKAAAEERRRRQQQRTDDVTGTRQVIVRRVERAMLLESGWRAVALLGAKTCHYCKAALPGVGSERERLRRTLHSCGGAARVICDECDWLHHAQCEARCERWMLSGADTDVLQLPPSAFPEVAGREWALQRRAPEVLGPGIRNYVLAKHVRAQRGCSECEGWFLRAKRWETNEDLNEDRVVYSLLGHYAVGTVIDCVCLDCNAPFQLPAAAPAPAPPSPPDEAGGGAGAPAPAAPAPPPSSIMLDTAGVLALSDSNPHSFIDYMSLGFVLRVMKASPRGFSSEAAAQLLASCMNVLERREPPLKALAAFLAAVSVVQPLALDVVRGFRSLSLVTLNGEGLSLCADGMLKLWTMGLSQVPTTGSERFGPTAVVVPVEKQNAVAQVISELRGKDVADQPACSTHIRAARGVAGSWRGGSQGVVIAVDQFGSVHTVQALLAPEQFADYALVYLYLLARSKGGGTPEHVLQDWACRLSASFAALDRRAAGELFTRLISAVAPTLGPFHSKTFVSPNDPLMVVQLFSGRPPILAASPRGPMAARGAVSKKAPSMLASVRLLLTAEQVQRVLVDAQALHDGAGAFSDGTVEVALLPSSVVRTDVLVRAADLKGMLNESMECSAVLNFGALLYCKNVFAPVSTALLPCVGAPRKTGNLFQYDDQLVVFLTTPSVHDPTVMQVITLCVHFLRWEVIVLLDEDTDRYDGVIVQEVQKVLALLVQEARGITSDMAADIRVRRNSLDADDSTPYLQSGQAGRVLVSTPLNVGPRSELETEFAPPETLPLVRWREMRFRGPPSASGAPVATNSVFSALSYAALFCQLLLPDGFDVNPSNMREARRRLLETCAALRLGFVTPDQVVLEAPREPQRAAASSAAAAAAAAAAADAEAAADAAMAAAAASGAAPRRFGAAAPSPLPAFSAFEAAMRQGFPELFAVETRVPSMHTFMHLCKLIWGAYVRSQRGNVHNGSPSEFAEHFNRALQLIAPQVRARSFVNALAYLNVFCKQHNDAVTRSLDAKLLKKLVKAIVALENAHGLLVADLRMLGRGYDGDETDRELETGCADRKEAAATHAAFDRGVRLDVSKGIVIDLNHTLSRIADEQARGLYYASAAGDLGVAAALAAFQIHDIASLAAFCASPKAVRGAEAENASKNFGAGDGVFVQLMRRALAEGVKGRALYLAAYATGAAPELQVELVAKIRPVHNALKRLLDAMRRYQPFSSNRDIRALQLGFTTADVTSGKVELPSRIGALAIEPGASSEDAVLDIFLRVLSARAELQLALRAPRIALENVDANIRDLEAQVAALRNGDLVAGAGVSGVFVPDATPEASMLVFSLHAPRAGEGSHALYVRGMLSEVLQGLAWWRSFRVRLARVALVAKHVTDEVGPRQQLDGLFGRLRVNKAGNATLLNKYGRVLVGTLRVTQWWYLGVVGVPEPPPAPVKEDPVADADAEAGADADVDAGAEDDGLGAEEGAENEKEAAAAAAEEGAAAAAAEAMAAASDDDADEDDGKSASSAGEASEAGASDAGDGARGAVARGAAAGADDGAMHVSDGDGDGKTASGAGGAGGKA